MSAFSTLTVSRSAALRKWRELTAACEPTNALLEEILLDLLQGSHNFRVLDDLQHAQYEMDHPARQGEETDNDRLASLQP